MRKMQLLRRSYTTLIALLVSSLLTLFAQTGGTTVKGTVTNKETGKPEQGVTVTIKSSKQSTVTPCSGLPTKKPVNQNKG